MKYSSLEMMAVAGARELRDGEVAFVGTGLPMLSAMLAQYTHAPGLVCLYESGYVGCHNIHTARLVGDIRLMYGLDMAASMVDVLGFLQSGRVDVGFIGGAQVDMYGNVNSTVIGRYEAPRTRLPGSGGANDIGSLAKRTIIICNHELRRFPERVDYITTPGFLDGGDARAVAGLRGAGPCRVITDLAIMGFDDTTKRMRLISLHPGSTVHAVQKNTGFDLLIPSEVAVTPEPTDDELRILREKVDPLGFYLGRRSLR